MLIKISDLNSVYKDDRGEILSFANEKYDLVRPIKRNKGSVGGKHYHKGELSCKNPEKFFLLGGTMKLLVKDLDNGITEEYILDKACCIEIPPKIYHIVTATTEIIFLEFGNFEDNYEEDTVRLEI